MTDEEASVASFASSSSGEQQPEPEEEPEEATDPSIGLYLAKWALVQSLIEDAKHAALAGYYARRAQLAAAGRVLDGLAKLNPEQWTLPEIQPRMKDTFDLACAGCKKEDLIENYRSNIAREQMNWPFPLLRTEGVLDVLLRVEKAARKQADLSEMELVTSLLTSVSLLRAAPEPLRRRSARSRVNLLEHEVREAGISSDHGLDGLTLALRERLAREDEDVRASAAWERAKARLPRGNAAADAWLADGILAASLEHPETLEPQDDDDVAVFVPWDDEDAHREALDEWRSWTLEEPSSLASVGRNRPGLRFDYRVDADGLVESYPERLSGAPTVVQPASALALPESLHGLVDGVVLGWRRTAWMRSEASS